MLTTCYMQAALGQSQHGWARRVHIYPDCSDWRPQVVTASQRVSALTADSPAPGCSEKTHNSPSGRQAGSPPSVKQWVIQGGKTTEEWVGLRKKAQKRHKEKAPVCNMSDDWYRSRQTFGDWGCSLCSRPFRCWFSACTISSCAWVICERMRKMYQPQRIQHNFTFGTKQAALICRRYRINAKK